MIVYIIALIISFVVSYALQPGPVKQKGQKPFGLGDFDFPTAEEGRPITIVFGKRFVDGGNVTWAANLRSVEIKE